MQGPQTERQSQQFIIRQPPQADHGGHHILEGNSRVHHKPSVGQTGTKRFITEQAPPRVLKKPGRAAQDDHQTARHTLQGVVIHGQNLLVIGLPADAVWNLIQIHALVDQHKESLIPDQAHKTGEQTDVGVPGGIVNDGQCPYADGGTGVGLGAVFTTQPPQTRTHMLRVIRQIGLRIAGQHRDVVVSAYLIAQRGKDLPYPIHYGGTVFFLGQIGGDLTRHRLHKAGEDPAPRTPVGGCLHGQIAGQFPVGGDAALAGQLSFGGQIGVRRHKAQFHSTGAKQLQKKALTAAVATDQKPHGGLSLRHPGKIVRQRTDLVHPADGNIGCSGTGHHTGGNAGQKGAQNPARYFLCIQFGGSVIHDAISSL